MEQKKPDLNELYKNFSKSIELYNDIIKQYPINDNSPKDLDPLNITPAIIGSFAELAKEPEKYFNYSVQFYQSLSDSWLNAAHNFLGDKPEEKKHHDKRFIGAEWENIPTFKFIRDAYLNYSDLVWNFVKNNSNLAPKDKAKLEFYTKQYLEAASPANYIWTNPQVLREMVESNGENLVRGLQNFAADLKNGKLSQADYKDFELGKNIATTKGKVVFQNDLMQLIQYEPTTEKVFQTPILFIPAWINKYYIADLRPDNSLIKWLVDSGYTVFVISWVNPDERQKDKEFKNYMYEGPIAAIAEIQKITGEHNLNAMGYCLGGTLLGTTLAFLEAKGNNPVKAATFLTTMLDFSDAGELSVFIDEEQISELEEKMNKRGYLDGKEMAITFNLLRPHDLIWSFVVNNYLLGKKPMHFDLLYWNSDTTRMPAKMHSYYLRNMYLQNNLAKGKLKIDDVKIDITKIKSHCNFLSTKKDHIAPWKTTYIGAKMIESAEFMLTDSGHIAGVVNPPGGVKYHHWINGKLPESPDEWEKNAKQVDGSWWTSWHKWNEKFSGDKIPARAPRNAIEAAPGSYAKVRS